MARWPWQTDVMTPAPDGIDALYQLPLAEFTAARNALAKSMGAAGAEVRALEKPTLPAWAFNQVFWKNRTAWDALVAASMAMRQAHVNKISGLDADVPAAEAAHRDALKVALAAAREYIVAAGEKATPATIESITDTLGAIPTPEPAGRLTKPLKPLGLAALMAMGVTASPAPETPSSGQAPKAAKARDEALRQADAAIREAKDAEAVAEAARDEARSAVTAAEREVDRARTQLVFLEKQAADARETLAARDRAATAATNARVQAERRRREI